jgi:hypothetical protein
MTVDAHSHSDEALGAPPEPKDLEEQEGAVAKLVGIEVGVVSGVFNLESPGVSALGWRLRHEEAYHAS